jgi:hypothetical protein
MIQYFQIIILDQFKPSAFSQIKVLLSDDVLQALMISVDLALGSHDVMPPNLQSMNHNYQLEIMCRIVLLMFPQLPRCIGYNMSLLHKNKTQAPLKRVTINGKALLQI